MNESQQRMIDMLSPCKRVLITTHVRPDGDALGASAAMVLALRTKNITADVLLLSHLPSKYAFVFQDNAINYRDVEEGWPDPATFADYDALLVVDTGTWSQLPGVKEHLLVRRMPRLVIDHHLTQEDWADVKLVDKSAAAAGEVVAGLLDAWGIAIDLPIARALYVAIVTDCGWFQFSNTRPSTLRLAARLMEAGVDTDLVYQQLNQNERAQRVALQMCGMQSMQLLLDGKLAVMQVQAADFAATGGAVTDTENMINFPLQIRTVQVSILLVEPPEGGGIRVSLRSKGQVDVAAFAETFGGGGHARASGLRLKGTLADARQQVLSAMTARLATT